MGDLTGEDCLLCQNEFSESSQGKRGWMDERQIELRGRQTGGHFVFLSPTNEKNMKLKQRKRGLEKE